MRDRKELVQGYTNRCRDGKYIVTLDYDNYNFEWIIDELKCLQADYMLGTFYMFESSPDCYHAVCLTKVSLNELVTIMRSTSIDTRYIDVPLRWGKKLWTLRLIGKRHPITFKRSIVNPVPYMFHREESQAHSSLLEEWFRIPIRLKKPDKFKIKDIVMSRYRV